MARSSIQVSASLRRLLERRKLHAREPYEEVIERALAAAEPAARQAAPALPKPVQAALDELKSKLAAMYGPRLRRLILYGSHARGDATPASDVDVLVVLAGPVARGAEIERIVESTYDILLARGVHLSAHPIEETEFLTRATPLLVNVRREGIPL